MSGHGNQDADYLNGRHKEPLMAETPMQERITGAPLDSYPPEDQAFFRFWYGHMHEDLMQPPLADIDHATARYIWNAARTSRWASEVEAARASLPAPNDADWLKEAGPALQWVQRCRHPGSCIKPRCGDFCYEAEPIARPTEKATPYGPATRMDVEIRLAALEEAAKACEATGREYWEHPEMAATCAAAIRALKKGE